METFGHILKHNISTSAYDELVDILQHPQFCINDIVTNIRRFRKWRQRLPLISIRSRYVKISTKKTPSTTCTIKPIYYLSVSDIIWYVLNNHSLFNKMYFGPALEGESPQFGQETIVIKQVLYQIGDYVYYNEITGKKFRRILVIILENNIEKLKIQRVLTFDELPESFHITIRQQQSHDGALWLLDRDEYNAIILLEPQAIIQKITVGQNNNSANKYIIEILYKHNNHWKFRSALLDYKHPSEYTAIPNHNNSLPVYKFFLDLYYDDFGTYRNVYHSLEICQLEKGKVFEINGVRCLIIASLGQVTADLPQGNDLAYIKRHGAIKGCRSCQATKEKLTSADLNIPLIARYHHITDELYNRMETIITATDQRKFATEYGLRNKKSILDLLKREKHLQTPQDVYHLTAGKIQRLLHITVNLLSNDGKKAFVTAWKSFEYPKDVVCN
ncbi:hypothetical protein RirG_222700 [Rhizophagus irregularis DAOM 197198w]|uniref:Uncharacterized protein n=1 Tax=Rhizophagus irregularis (strain DAOM 197198w) TaxID=1432141 RepID=A0A015JLD8_RHIIW|nr:hypothetical protein RirG_222700 [Rhizophagus irregularis DAOM 197198w]